jgi:hypothetical protein
MTEVFDESKNDPHLLQLVLSLETAAMQQMGKLQNPFTGKVERNLELARNSIDMLAMIERKTDGNLTAEEASLIKRALYQLRMNYVDELKSEEKAEKDTKAEETPVNEADGNSGSEGGTDETIDSEKGEPG